MEIQDILVRALKEVQDAELPEALQPAAFAKVVEMLNGLSLPPLASASAPTGPSQDAAGKVASRLKITPAAVREIYHFDGDGTFEVIVSPKKLSQSVMGATQEIALLVSGATQLGTGQEWTSINEVRSACERYGRYDSANFARTISKMADVFSIKGRGQQRELRLTRIGEDQLSELVTELTGGAT